MSSRVSNGLLAAFDRRRRGHSGMGMLMACQFAGIRCAVVRDGSGSIWRNNVDVKIDQSLARDAPAGRSHAVGGMACGTTESIVDVTGVLGKGRIGYNLGQVMTLSA